MIITRLVLALKWTRKNRVPFSANYEMAGAWLRWRAVSGSKLMKANFTIYDYTFFFFLVLVWALLIFGGVLAVMWLAHLYLNFL